MSECPCGSLGGTLQPISTKSIAPCCDLASSGPVAGQWASSASLAGPGGTFQCHMPPGITSHSRNVLWCRPWALCGTSCRKQHPPPPAWEQIPPSPSCHSTLQTMVRSDRLFLEIPSNVDLGSSNIHLPGKDSVFNSGAQFRPWDRRQHLCSKNN